MSVIIKPLITEKSSMQKAEGKLFFKVKKDANKIQIRQEIEQLFNVKVASVNTVNVKGKVKRVGKKVGVTSDWKKAVVVLKDGQKIQEYEDIF